MSSVKPEFIGFAGDYVVDRYSDLAQDFSGGVTQNTLRAFHAIGTPIPIWAIGCVGSDSAGTMMIEDFRGRGIHTALLSKDGEETPVFGIKRDASGERYFENVCRGCFPVTPARAKTVWDTVGKRSVLSRGSGVLFFATYPDVLSYLKTAVDDERCLAHPWILDLSDEPILRDWDEAFLSRVAAASSWVFRSINDRSDASERLLRDRWLREWRQNGWTETLEWITMMGSEGVEIVIFERSSKESEKQYRLPIKNPVDPVDTNGAGDAFAGTYLALRLGDQTVMDAGVRAMDAARRCILNPGPLCAIRLN